MTPEEREATERRLIEINRRLGFLAFPEVSEEAPPELDSEELNELCEERDMLMKELDEDVD
jgi:hypothetical protein